MSLSARTWALPPDCNPESAQSEARIQSSEETSRGTETGSICDPEDPPPPPERAAGFSSQSVPAKMVAGQGYNVTVVMRNNGSATWTSAAGYKLGSQNPGDNTTWGGHRVALPASIASGQDASFSFPVTAPATAGSYNFQWRMLQEGVTWFGTSTTNQAIEVVTSTVTGNVDGVADNAIVGWACSTHLDDSISVHLYAGGAAGTGTGWSVGFVANQASEAAVASACSANGTAYRFSIPISADMVTQHGGKSIYVHGISPVGGSNSLLGQSGTYTFPLNQAPTVSLSDPTDGVVIAEATGSVTLSASAADADDGVASVSFYDGTQLLGTDNTAPYEYSWSNVGAGTHTVQAQATDTRGAITASATRTVKVSRVIGDIGGVTTDNLLWGWACSTFVNTSIPVHLYVGGPAGTGTGVGSYTANVTSDAAVANACQASGTAYIFHIPISQDTVTAHGGKSIHVHGISPLSGYNNTISNSGTYSIPGNQPPTVNLTSPAEGATATIPGSFTLTATAADADDGLASVDFYQGDTWLVTDTSSPYSHSVSDLAVGSYTFKAVAKDSRGATTSSQVTAKVEAKATGGSSQPQLVTVRRKYVYDVHQQLCKVIEPETGVTVMDYDGAGNLQWSAAGLALTDATRCDTLEGRDSGRKVTRLYDNRNRLSSLSFPDGLGNQTWTYTADGLPASISTYNSNGGDSVINAYSYNKRRMLTGESVQQPGWYTWGIGYGYDAQGHLATQTYPTGLVIGYAPNAMGQATQAKDQFGNTYASGVQYYPNGAIKQFTYGNGIVHAMQQNVRQLPSRSTDGGVFDYTFKYDANGNTTEIKDVNEVAGAYSGSRDMEYDALNRLTMAHLHWQQIDRWKYDAQDNIVQKEHFDGSTNTTTSYLYDSNRLVNLRNEAGATTAGLNYDVQGNLSNKNGVEYHFDYGNRLREVVEKEWLYRYDARGNRVLAGRADGITVSQYSQSGQLAYYEQTNKGNFEQIYLAGSLLAIRNSGVVKFQHTDALGSPVAVTDIAGMVVERSAYEPYGAIINSPSYDGMGFTGHKQDAATGLTYMQQRYYDPTVGRFLSVDPVTAYGGDVRHFNAYAYAYNNPYKFTDPDGRRPPGCGDGTCEPPPPPPPPPEQSKVTTLAPVTVTGTRQPSGGSDPFRPKHNPSFFQLTTFSGLRKDMSSQQAVDAGALTRTVTMPAIIVTASPSAIALGASAAPTLGEAALIGARYAPRGARAACMAGGLGAAICNGKAQDVAEDVLDRLRQRQEIRDGLMQEARDRAGKQSVSP